MRGVGVEGPWSRGRGLLTRAGTGLLREVGPAAQGAASRGLGLVSAGAAAAGTPFTLHHRRMTAGTVGVHYRDHELLEVI